MLTRYVLIGFILALFSAAVHSQNLGKVDEEVKSNINAALEGYYSVKDALVNSDAGAANQRAGELITLIQAISDHKMTDSQKAYWARLSSQLLNDTEQIRDAGDIESQRVRFVRLSNNVFSLLKGFRANRSSVYLHYCPMKKATWLSASKEVRNPYYGSKMLDCGSVRSVLK